MKKLLLFISILLVIACNPSSKDSNGDAAGISLNDGEKWEVNAEMRPFIEQGNDILTGYLAANKTDYQTLAKELKDQNAKLIESCTMRGKSHDELHKWLHPHMALIEELEEAENSAEAIRVIEDLQTSFKDYKTSFK